MVTDDSRYVHISATGREEEKGICPLFYYLEVTPITSAHNHHLESTHMVVSTAVEAMYPAKQIFPEKKKQKVFGCVCWVGDGGWEGS